MSLFRFMGPRARELLGPQAVQVVSDAISPVEEASLMAELDPVLRRRRYARDHWDNVIVGYKEVERPVWNDHANERTVDSVRRRIESMAGAHLPPNPNFLPVHVVDLDNDGYITPHVDSVRQTLTKWSRATPSLLTAAALLAPAPQVKFSGGLVCGISLLSAAVMTLRPEDPAEAENPEASAQLFLPPRSLYILSGPARYKFTHSVDGGIRRDTATGSMASPSFIDSKRAGSKGARGVFEEDYERSRRVSLIFRDTKTGHEASGELGSL